MDNILHTKEVDLALEATSGMVLTSDTVAIWNEDDGMYGVYVKGDGEALWWLKLTSLNIQNLMGERS